MEEIIVAVLIIINNILVKILTKKDKEVLEKKKKEIEKLFGKKEFSEDDEKVVKEFWDLNMKFLTKIFIINLPFLLGILYFGPKVNLYLFGFHIHWIIYVIVVSLLSNFVIEIIFKCL
jgi:ABC-type antimicrobial peptide transport system permease subunit